MGVRGQNQTLFRTSVSPQTSLPHGGTCQMLFTAVSWIHPGRGGVAEDEAVGGRLRVGGARQAASLRRVHRDE